MKTLLAAGAWAVLALLALSGCTGNQDRLAGSGSVTTNGLSGRVLRDGLPASGIAIILYPGGFDPMADSAPPARQRQITDRSGGYRFENLDTGTYNLVAAHPGDDAMAIRTGIEIAKGDSAVLDPLTLTAAGRIRVRLPEDARQAGSYVYLPGSPVFAVVDSVAAAAGEVVLPGVPAGTFASVLYAAGTDPLRNLLKAPITVAPEGVGTVYPYSAWARAYSIAIDASASGAATAEDVAGFPLLVRLTPADFDFAAAAADGSDLRVTKADSATPLAFEFETWDAQSKAAILWVRLDTLKAGLAGQAIRLFAGMPGAGRAPRPRAVFDTASGFAGIWHLDEIPAAGQPTMLDRTENAYHGTSFGQLDAEASVPGVIGRALRFDGTGDYVQLAGSDRFIAADGQALSVSAWIRPAAVGAGDSIRHRLATFKTDTVGISALALGVGSDARVSHYTRASDSVFHWPAGLTADSLYHVGLTFAAGMFRGYVDGREVYSVAAPMGRGGPSPALLGAHLPGQLGFGGWVDEFRIEKAARSPSWIRLAYETQRPGAPCVRIVPFAP